MPKCGRAIHRKLGSSLFPMEWSQGLPEGSCAKRCPGSGALTVCRVSATHPNPAWHPKQPSLWPLFLQTCTTPSREPHRSLTVAPLIGDQRGDGEAPGRSAGGSGAGWEEPGARGSAVLGRQAGFGWVAETRQTGKGPEPGHPPAPDPSAESPLSGSPVVSTKPHEKHRRLRPCIAGPPVNTRGLRLLGNGIN
jgi:hypothetical protein